MNFKIKLKFDNIIAEALKITTGLTFLLIFLESLGNYTFFYNFFPRKGFFTIIFDATILKFISLPALQLTFVTFFIYFFIIFFFVYTLFSLWENLSLGGKKPKWIFFVFFAVNIYIALYVLYGLNGFLCPRSQGRHFFLYKIFFLVEDNFHQPFPFWLGARYYLASFYWLGIFIFALKKSKQKVILIIMPIVVVLVVGFSFLLSNIFLVRTFKEKDNIIFIGIDSIQYNQLSKEWGYEKDLAPNIYEFLDNSTCFMNAWTPFARTYPSYNSLLTGRYPINNGARANLVQDQYLKKDNVYLGDLLKEKDYYRLHCTDDVRFSNIREKHGFDQIFCPRKDITGLLVTAFYDYAFCNIMIQADILPWLFKPVSYNRAHSAYSPGGFIKAVIKRINKLPKDKRQFIVIHLCANHQPHSSSYLYERNENLINSSERCISMADDQFKELIKYFKKSGLYDKSKIVLLSDHGSGWSEEEVKLTHGSDFYSPWANRIVLGFYPNLEGKFSRRINSLVRSVDIYPTILEMLGIDIPRTIDGMSLLPLMRGEKIESRKLFAESGYSFRIQFGQEITINPKDIHSEIKRFGINPKNGFVYIRDQDYKDLIERKWYMVINKDQRLIYNPFLDITEIFAIDTESGEDIPFVSQEQDLPFYLDRDQKLLAELKKHFKLE